MILPARKSLLPCLALLASVTAASAATAGTITTWRGNSPTNNNWSQATNWSTVPTTSGTFSLVYSGTPSRTISQNNVGVVKVDSILFSNDGTAGKDASFRLSATAGNSLSLISGAKVTTVAVSTGGTLSDVFATNVSLLGTGTFDVGSNHNVVISGTLNASGRLTKLGGGELQLTGPATLSGLSIDSGVVQLSALSETAVDGVAVSIGSSGSSGALVFNAASGSSSPIITLKGNASISARFSSNITFTSSTFNTADATIVSPVTLSLLGGGNGNAGTEVISGKIQDNSGTGKVAVTIGDAATTNVWVLNGDSTYTGATTVASGGNLLLNGRLSAGTTTTSDGFVGGSGTFAGALTIASGTLSPGGTASANGVLNDSIGALTVASLSLSGSATTVMAISSTTSYDQIVATGVGSLNYGGTLALSLSGTYYADGTHFDLFQGFSSPTGNLSSITLSATGSYAGLKNFSGPTAGDWYSDWTAGHQRFKFSQSTGQLTVVPEPSTIVFAGIGLAMFGWSTWTRRRARLRRRLIESAIG